MRGIYKVTPENWPEWVFFGDPCNKMAEGGRPKKEMVRNMCVQLFKMYQATNIQVMEGKRHKSTSSGRFSMASVLNF